MPRSSRGHRGSPVLSPSPPRPRPNSKEKKRNKSVNITSAAAISLAEAKVEEPEVPLVWRADWANLHEVR